MVLQLVESVFSFVGRDNSMSKSESISEQVGWCPAWTCCWVMNEEIREQASSNVVASSNDGKGDVGQSSSDGWEEINEGGSE